MNIVFFDPYFIQPDKIAEIIDILKIKEVYNLLPYDELSKSISTACGNTLVIRRNANETLDAVKKRTVYKLVSHISTPIIYNGEWTGECYVADKYKDSNYRRFCENLCLDHPNALILLSLSKNHSDELAQSQIKIMTYFFNILKKYSKIDYKSRICCKILSAYLTLEYQEFALLDGPFKVIANHFLHQNFSSIASHFLSERGIKERERQIVIKKEEDRQNMLDQDYYDPDPWGAKSEMDYIRNNGGDWIDD